MAKTYEDLILESRALLQDSLSPYRYEDSKLLNILNRGLQDLGRIRPDAFYSLYDANTLNIPIITDTDPAPEGDTLWTADFGIEMQFYPPLVSYVVGVAELFDDEFTLDGRAMALLNQFRMSVIGI
jgi:hypothetical protein